MEQATALIERHWRAIVLLAWLVFCCIFVLSYWPDILLFNLSDSDDNLRLMQVRDLLNGQHWYDLRQYRLNPPAGANIHWSRLVDLPLAGLILALRPFVDDWHAERLAVAIAPLLPLLLLLFSLALTVRRLVHPKAYLAVFLSLYFCGATDEMFMPERIDHHGWQIALLALSISALTDRKHVRGGVTLGISTALSLVIGLEMIVYLVVAGAAITLFWVADLDEQKRLRAYAFTLSAATTTGYLLFASNDNRLAVCDALSPVWLFDALVGGALLYALAWLSPRGWRQRLALASAAAASIAIFHGLVWPECLHRLDGVSGEEQQLWLQHVLEVWPLYRRGWRVIALVAAVTVPGLIGWAALAWIRRRDHGQCRQVLGAAAPGVASTLLMFWESRTVPTAQMTATVGCAALIWVLVPLAWRIRSHTLALVAALITILVGSGASMPLVLSFVPADPPTDNQMAMLRADSACPSLWAMDSVGLQPKGVVMTFVDLGPRLITVTHHDAIAGPYHRNSQEITDTMKFWRGPESQAHALAAKYRASYVLSCPGSAVTTVFKQEAPNGFYMQLERGEIPKWLAPVDLAPGSPFRMWKVVD